MYCIECVVYNVFYVSICCISQCTVCNVLHNCLQCIVYTHCIGCNVLYRMCCIQCIVWYTMSHLISITAYTISPGYQRQLATQCIVYNVLDAMYGIECVVDNVLYISMYVTSQCIDISMYCLQCIVYSQCIGCNVSYRMCCIVYNVVYNILYTIHGIQCIVYNTLQTMYCISQCISYLNVLASQCSVCNVSYRMCCIVYNVVYNTLYNIHCIQCIVYNTLYTCTVMASLLNISYTLLNILYVLVG